MRRALCARRRDRCGSSVPHQTTGSFIDVTGENRLPELFLDRLWPGLLAWTVLYISDYSLTIMCARLYQAGANQKMAFEGSYEITPYYQRDINALGA